MSGERTVSRRERPPVVFGVGLALMFAVMTAACGGSGATTAPTGETATSSQSAPRTPIAAPPGGFGIYVTAAAPGTNRLTLLPDGRYTQDVGLGVTGRWVYSNGKITFTETHGITCPDIAGTYRWTYDGTKLALTAVSDQCPDRVVDLENSPWSKQ